MTSNVELLPLPPARLVINHDIGPISETDPFWNRRDMSEYARANVEHHTEALRAELEQAKGRAAANLQRAADAEVRAERLAEALRLAMQALIPLHNAHMPDERAGLTDEDVAAAAPAFEQARAALDQEKGSGYWPEMPKNGGPDWTGFDG